MYSIYDKRSAIREIQKYLGSISKIHISQNGIYDERTKEAVTIFQKEKGITPSGIVDRGTFSVLYKEYIISLQKNRLQTPISFGSYGNTMEKINSKIIMAMNYYGIDHRMKRSKMYSKETENSVNKLRQIYNLDLKNEIDSTFYTRLITDTENMY